MPRGIPKNPEKAAASRKAANEAKKTGGKTTQKKRKTKGGDDATTWGAAANMALLVAVANKVMPEAGLTDKQWSEVVAAMGEEFAGTKSTAAQYVEHSTKYNLYLLTSITGSSGTRSSREASSSRMRWTNSSSSIRPRRR